MYFCRVAILIFSFLIYSSLSTSDTYLDVYLQCNDNIMKEKLPINKYSDKDVPFFKITSRCTSKSDHVKIIIPESNSVAISKLTSNIMLIITMNDGKIIGINMVENEHVVDNEHVYSQIKVVNMNTIPDINPEISVIKEADNQKTTEAQPSFLRKYWWLIAIGFISYSVLTADQSLIESTEGNLASEQLQQGETNRKTNKKKRA